MRNDKNCETCKWYEYVPAWDDHICGNNGSRHKADWQGKNDTCDKWEGKRDE